MDEWTGGWRVDGRQRKTEGRISSWMGGWMDGRMDEKVGG